MRAQMEKTTSFVATAPSRSMSVLVIDDEPEILEEVTETLEDEGFDCLSAETADRALELLQERADIGVIVSDIRMPGMDGLQMAEQAIKLTEQGRDLSVIMVTGHAGMAEAIRALKIGVDDFLTKPISPEHLIHAVERSRELVRLRWQDRAFKAALEIEVAERTAEVRDLMAILEKKNHDLTLANRAKDEFLDMISHEMNTPMNAVLGFSQLLREDAVASGDETQVQTIDEILRAGHLLHRKLQNILSMAGAARGDGKLFLEKTDGGELLTLVRDTVQQAADDKNVRVDIDVPDVPVGMTADKGRLLQALRFLADNAIRYSPDGAKVHLAIAIVDEGNVSFAVTDNGAGMDDEQLGAALEPLRRGLGAFTDQEGGVGLGLPLARTFAEMHGGTMTVQSAPGAGTTVTLTIPLGMQEHT